MRQFVFGLLVAGFLWWAYGGKSAAAEGPGAAGQPVAPVAASGASGPLDQMLGGAATPRPANSTAPLDANGQGAAANNVSPAFPTAFPTIDALLTGLGEHSATAVAAGWSALAQGRLGKDRARVVEALASGGNDFPALLVALGADNSFLHAAEGRAAGAKALAAAMALPDAEVVAAGSRLLGLSLRGRIERADTDARAFVDEAYKQYRVRADRWLCDPANVASSRSYTVASGDSLARIAGKFRREKILVEDGTLAVLNRISNPNALQIGQKVKVPVEPIHVVVEKRSFSLAVYVGDNLLRLYWVGHGENDKTPVTEFTVAEKQPKPEWTAPDGQIYAYGHPKNILGEYFIKLRHDQYTGFGAHGTPMPETIGTMSSAGCIRMLAPDIAELFKILPRGVNFEVRASESLR